MRDCNGPVNATRLAFAWPAFGKPGTRNRSGAMKEEIQSAVRVVDEPGGVGAGAAGGMRSTATPICVSWRPVLHQGDQRLRPAWSAGAPCRATGRDRFAGAGGHNQADSRLPHGSRRIPDFAEGGEGRRRGGGDRAEGRWPGAWGRLGVGAWGPGAGGWASENRLAGCGGPDAGGVGDGGCHGTNIRPGPQLASPGLAPGSQAWPQAQPMTTAPALTPPCLLIQ